MTRLVAWPLIVILCLLVALPPLYRPVQASHLPASLPYQTETWSFKKILVLAQAMVNATKERYLVDGYGYPYLINTTSGSVVDYTMHDCFPILLHIYSLTADESWLVNALDFYLSKTYNSTGKFFCRYDLTTKTKTGYAHHGAKYAPILLTLFYAYLHTQNQTFLNVLKEVLNTIVSHTDADGLIADYYNSDGSVTFSEIVATHQFLFGLIPLYTVGAVLDNTTITQIAENNINFILSLASPMFPGQFNRSSDLPHGQACSFSGWGVPCCLMDCIRLLRYYNKSYSLLLKIGKVLVNTYMLHAQKDTNGLIYIGLLNYTGDVVATPDQYNFFHQVNHLRFCLLFYLLTKNETVLSFVETSVNKIEKHFKAPFGYYSTINATTFAPIDKSLYFQIFCKYLGILSRLYLVTHNNTYLSILEDNIENVLPKFLDVYGVAQYIDAETGIIKSDKSSEILAIYEGICELLSALFWQEDGIFWSDAVGRLKVAAFGTYDVFGKSLTLYTTANITAPLRCSLPLIGNVWINGTEWFAFNISTIIVPQGLKEVKIELGSSIEKVVVTDLRKCTFKSAVLTATTFELTVSISTGTLAQVVVYPATRGMPSSITIGGHTFTSPAPTKDDFDKATTDCWYYDSIKNLIYIKIRGHSPVEIVVSWTVAGGVAPPPPEEEQPVVSEARREALTWLLLLAVLAFLVLLVAGMSRKK